MKKELLPSIADNLIKYIGGFQVVFGIVAFFANGLDWPSASETIVMGLTLVLLTKETVNDERVEHLKLKAIRHGCYAGLITVLCYRLLVTIWKVFGPVQYALSAYDALIIILVVALGLFHFWRCQDGRTERVSLRGTPS